MNTQTSPQTTAQAPGIFEILTNIAASRNWISSLVGALGFFVLIGSLDQASAQKVVDAAQRIMDGFGMMVGGAKEIFIILWPIVQGGISGIAGKSSTLQGVLAWLGQDKNKDQGIVVVAPAPVANSVPAANVIAADKATVVAAPEVAAVVASAAPAAPVVSTQAAAAAPEILQK